MKIKVRTLSYFLLLITFSFNQSVHIYGQDRFNISAGLGFPDGLSLGGRYQLKHDTLQIGISAGVGGYVGTISGDFFYNFGGYSKLSSRPPIYFKSGITIFIPDSEYEWGPLFKLLIGRDINLSKKTGLNIEGGIAFSITATKMLPGFGLCFFYRI